MIMAAIARGKTRLRMESLTPVRTPQNVVMLHLFIVTSSLCAMKLPVKHGSVIFLRQTWLWDQT
jgi:hypothetical protein